MRFGPGAKGTALMMVLMMVVKTASADQEDAGSLRGLRLQAAQEL